eukprot:3353-Heterococcus_DN1.PRE.3
MYNKCWPHQRPGAFLLSCHACYEPRSVTAQAISQQRQHTRFTMNAIRHSSTLSGCCIPADRVVVEASKLHVSRLFVRYILLLASGVCDMQHSVLAHSEEYEQCCLSAVPTDCSATDHSETVSPRSSQCC